MITVRPAIVADYPEILAFGKRFHEACPYRVVEYDAASVYRFSETAREQGMLLVAELDGKLVGAAAGVKGPLLNNNAYTVGTELFWWVEPEARSSGAGKALLDGLEQMAKAAGCHFWSMVCFEDENLERMDATYKRRGYAPTEHTYLKRIG